MSSQSVLFLKSSIFSPQQKGFLGRSHSLAGTDGEGRTRRGVLFCWRRLGHYELSFPYSCVFQVFSRAEFKLTFWFNTLWLPTISAIFFPS